VALNWQIYLALVVTRLSPISGHTLLMVIGVVEIAAGILVAIRPRLRAWVVMAWLLGIILDLLLVSGFYDVALRDFGLSLGALALARLSVEFDQ
jgi:uncharacterized membrane protein HdeD (DUF308 family)